MEKIYLIIQTLIVLFGTKDLTAQCNIPSNVPYYEGFSTITSNNQLPLCWQASNIGVTCLTYTGTGSSAHAGFSDAVTGQNHFYTRALQLNAGVTYSAALWYKTDNTGSTNWTDLSILYGTAQTPTGLISIVSTSGPALSPSYILLSSTFTVSSSGVYYISVRGTSNSGSSHYLSWDELQVAAACGVAGNTPSMSIAASSSVICSGQESQVTFTAAGADTYTWNTGAMTSTTSGSSSVGFYQVVGTNTLSGCTATASKIMFVSPSPNVILYTNTMLVCLGSSAVIQSMGASNYSWSVGTGTTGILSVTPTTTTTYSVTGFNSFGCYNSGSITLTTVPLPVVNAILPPIPFCVGEEINLSASGAINYTWIKPGGNVSTGQSLMIPAPANATYTLIGTDANGCKDTQYVSIIANQCTGLNSIEYSGTTLLVYPNPSSFEVNIDFSGEYKNVSIKLIDLSGRSVACKLIQDAGDKLKINIDHLNNGIYFLEIQQLTKIERVKIIKE